MQSGDWSTTLVTVTGDVAPELAPNTRVHCRQHIGRCEHRVVVVRTLRGEGNCTDKRPRRHLCVGSRTTIQQAWICCKGFERVIAQINICDQNKLKLYLICTWHSREAETSVLNVSLTQSLPCETNQQHLV